MDGQLPARTSVALGNPVAITDPLDHGAGEGFAQGADTPFSIEAVGRFLVGQAFAEISDAVDNRGRIPHAVSSIGRELHANVTAGAALPPDVNQKLFQMGGFSTVISLMSSRNIRLRSLAWVVGACHKRGKSVARARTLAFCSSVVTRLLDAEILRPVFEVL